MKAIELIGKNAIRTKRTKGIGDGSYTSTPIKILYADDNHIIYQHCTKFEIKVFGKEKHILPCDFCDDNWVDYDELMKKAK